VINSYYNFSVGRVYHWKMIEIEVTHSETAVSRTANYWSGMKFLASIHQHIQPDGTWSDVELIIPLKDKIGGVDMGRELIQALTQTVQQAEYWNYLYAGKRKESNEQN